ncbi:alkyl hydroperoxide reductase/ thiol specific antioxidant/ Mal allergen [Arthrobacter crystallopoietes BAB-32]|uniref:Alkyl hydroperoxide reductase E n=1 Tax=Arthrobacter crystallopoietes BAB-32 TaxID=1246476 RepID=N1UZ79_9MICC|nr:peroxiredoxin [Arthrobacter crystallopoietes]EMY34360.1 alkyl hydroperoxide reductase/ thiol specific antioxidant/ Mal allergen [Arthrobacter crystallopoietes BAB-32]
MTEPVIGQPAPDFELSNQFGEPVRLSALRGENIVLVFYPFAFSGICTGELCELRDDLESFKSENARVLGISIDHKFALRAFADREGYEFDLLADFWPHGAVAKTYGVFDDESGMALRGTFIVDAEGVLRHVIRNSRSQARDIQEYHRILKEL